MKINNTAGFTIYKIVLFFIVFIASFFFLIKSASTNSETEKINTDKYNQNVYSNVDYEMPVVQQNYESQRTEYYENDETKYYENDETKYDEFSNYVVIDNRAYFYDNPDLSTKRKAYLVINEIVYIQQIINGFGFAEFTNVNGKTSKGWLLLKNIQYCSNCDNTTVYHSSNYYEEQNTETYVDNNKDRRAEPYEGYQVFYNNFIEKFNLTNVRRNVDEISMEVKFTVDKDGSFSNIYINGEDLYDLSEEIISVFETMPKWKPAISESKPIQSSFTMPLKIKL